MAKVRVYEQSYGLRIWFLCPGCDRGHNFEIRNDGQRPSWTFNDDVNSPTCTPSLLYPNATPRCHLYLTDGTIRFLEDCGHALAGQTVNLPDLDETKC